MLNGLIVTAKTQYLWAPYLLTIQLTVTHLTTNITPMLTMTSGTVSNTHNTSNTTTIHADGYIKINHKL